MIHPSLALQQSIHAALVGDAVVGALVGDRIHDAAPRNATFPYVTFGPARSDDWSTDTETGAEHRFVLEVWSRHRGKSEGWAILEAIRMVLDDAALSLDDHVLVNLRFETSDIRRDPDGLTWHGIMRFRAVTEPAA